MKGELVEGKIRTMCLYNKLQQSFIDYVDIKLLDALELDVRAGTG